MEKFGRKSYFRKIKDNLVTEEANALSEGEGEYYFNSHGARGEEVK